MHLLRRAQQQAPQHAALVLQQLVCCFGRDLLPRAARVISVAVKPMEDLITEEEKGAGWHRMRGYGGC